MAGRSLAGIVTAAMLAAALLLTAPASHSLAAASSCAIDSVDRIVAIGDAHGAYDRYVALLKSAGLVDDRLAWTGGKTHLVQIGDVVDRGADSRKILDLLRLLERSAPRDGGAVHVLLGNHEVMRMLGDFRYVTPGEYQAFVKRDSEETRKRILDRAKPEEREALARTLPLGSVEMQLAFAPRGEYGQWLRSLDAVAKINGILFLHGGISPGVATISCDEINATVRRELTTDFEKVTAAPAEALATREDGPLWYRGLAEQPDEFAASVDAILASEKATAIVIGHTVSPTGRIRVRFGGKVFQIDTGMQPAYVAGGHASALEIQGGRFTAIYDDKREPLDVPAP
jgi:hypothetical protein